MERRYYVSWHHNKVEKLKAILHLTIYWPIFQRAGKNRPDL